MTNGWECATIDMTDRCSFLVTGHGVPVATRPASLREEVTSGQLCDGSRPDRHFGSDSLLIRSPRWPGRRRPRHPARTRHDRSEQPGGDEQSVTSGSSAPHLRTSVSSHQPRYAGDTVQKETHLGPLRHLHRPFLCSGRRGGVVRVHDLSRTKSLPGVEGAGQAEAQLGQAVVCLLKFPADDAQFADGGRTEPARTRVHGAPALRLDVAADERGQRRVGVGTFQGSHLVVPGGAARRRPQVCRLGAGWLS